MDWKDQTRKGELHAFMIPALNLNDTIGEITKVDWSSASFTASYYADTRISGQITIYDDEWIRNSWIRIVYDPDTGDERERPYTIGTFIVIDDDARWRNGRWETVLELRSSLYAISLDIADDDDSMWPGMSLSAATWREAIWAGFRNRFKFNGNDPVLARSQFIEAGRSRLSNLFALCEMGNNRLETDENGYIVVEPYINPAYKSPVLQLDLDDEHGVTFDDVARETDWLQMPTRTVVQYDVPARKSGGGTETVGRAITVSEYKAMLKDVHRILCGWVDGLTASDYTVHCLPGEVRTGWEEATVFMECGGDPTILNRLGRGKWHEMIHDSEDQNHPAIIDKTKFRNKIEAWKRQNNYVNNNVSITGQILSSTSEYKIFGEAMSQNKHQSFDERGYTITDYHKLSELSPETKGQADYIARQYRQRSDVQHVEWKVKTKFLPLREGDVINLNINVGGLKEYQGVRKCLVKNIDMRGPYMDMELTLKETASGDWEE